MTKTDKPLRPRIRSCRDSVRVLSGKVEFGIRNKSGEHYGTFDRFTKEIKAMPDKPPHEQFEDLRDCTIIGFDGDHRTISEWVASNADEILRALQFHHGCKRTPEWVAWEEQRQRIAELERVRDELIEGIEIHRGLADMAQRAQRKAQRERDELREQLRLANIDAANNEAESNELREKLRQADSCTATVHCTAETHAPYCPSYVRQAEGAGTYGESDSQDSDSSPPRRAIVDGRCRYCGAPNIYDRKVTVKDIEQGPTHIRNAELARELEVHKREGLIYPWKDDPQLSKCPMIAVPPGVVDRILAALRGE